MALLPALLSACKDDEPGVVYTGYFGFCEGVASFDPSATNVILWTRYTAATNESGDASIRREVAENSTFAPAMTSGTVPATTATDYTVAVNVSSFQANKKYYYRFSSERTAVTSVVGKTRTLPRPAA